MRFHGELRNPMDEWLRKRCGLPQSISLRGETASSAGQSRISEQGGARLRQVSKTAEVKQSDSGKNVRGVELEIASATEIVVLCRTAPACAISWQMGQFAGSPSSG